MRLRRLLHKKRAAEPQPLLTATLRLLDANLNRCREGLRVLEDTARFAWNDVPLFNKLRSARHAMDHWTRKFYPQLILARNSEKDEGRTITEGGRKDLRDLVAANFRRCEESLRVLEEYGKVFTDGAASQFKKIRFELYELEKIASKRCGMKPKKK